MKDYLAYRNTEIKKLHELYSKELPQIISEFLFCKEVERLRGIGQHCGTEYVKFPMFQYRYFFSRLDHSLGVALILWNFTRDLKQTVAGFLHDISSTVFAHVGDFMKKDYINQESTEENTEKIIRGSNQIFQILSLRKLNVKDVVDYKIYPLADNKSPSLSADRLECCLHYPLIRGDWTIEDIKKIYNSICILQNENGQIELGIDDIDTAKKLCSMSIKNGKIDSSDEDKLCMQFLADILKFAINEGVIKEHDLYTKTDKEIINIIEECRNSKLLIWWNYYKNMTHVGVSVNPLDSKYYICFDVKKRYINPLVKTDSGVYRLSEITADIKNEIDNFTITKPLKYIYINCDR